MSKLDPDWPPMWKHAECEIPFPSYWPLWLRCTECGDVFLGTRYTARRVTCYREHWLREHSPLPYQSGGTT